MGHCNHFGSEQEFLEGTSAMHLEVCAILMSVQLLSMVFECNLSTYERDASQKVARLLVSSSTLYSAVVIVPPCVDCCRPRDIARFGEDRRFTT